MRPFIPLQQNNQPDQSQQQSSNLPQQEVNTQDVCNKIASQVKPSIDAIASGQATPEAVFMRWYNGMNRQQKNCLKKAMNTGLVKNIFKKFGVSEANYDLASKLINNSN